MHRVRADENGLVILYVAMLMPVILIMAGLSVDVGNWQYHTRKLQNTADLAALGGVVYLPGNVSGAASAAIQIAGANGFAVGGTNKVSVVAAPVPGHPTQLKVSVSETVPSLFAGIIGLFNQNLSRSAIAEFQQPVDMGSPASVFGAEPVAGLDSAWSNVPAFVPQLWGNVYAPGRAKSAGDAIQGNVCDANSLDGCQAGVNVDYSGDGYFYRVTVDPAQALAHAGHLLAIEVYDAAAVDVGDHCASGYSGLERAGIVTNNAVPTAAEALIRYGWGDTSNTPNTDLTGAWCSGDNGTATTTFVVRQDLNPYAPQANPVVTTGDPNAGGCQGEQFGSWAATTSLTKGLGNLLNKADANYDDHLAHVFRQWVPICAFNPTVVPATDYLVQVRTNISPTADQSVMQGAPSSPLPSDVGGNRFAIRAAWVTDGTAGVGWTAASANTNPKRSVGDPYVGGYPVTPRPNYVDSLGISIAGSTAMSLYANAASGTVPNYYMARVLPGAQAQTLEIRLWDIGDCSGTGCSPTLTFHLPASQGAAIPNCTWAVHDGPPGASGIGAPRLTVVTAASCTYKIGSQGETANGSWYTIDLAIPAGYTCTPTLVTDCWFTMNYAAGSGSLSDATTWGARIVGNPVRLVQ